MACNVPKGVIQFMVLVSSRLWGRYLLGMPDFIRNDSRFNTLILKIWLDFCLSRMASSSFDLHIDRVSSVSAYSVYEPPRGPS
jgi:hypothetical protein